MKRIKNIFSIIAIAIFVSYYASSTMFSHTHTFEWGSVTHSHPYVPQGGHSHSSTSCSLIAHFGALLFLAAAFGLVIALHASIHHFVVEVVRRTSSCVIAFYSLRAPPVC